MTQANDSMTDWLLELVTAYASPPLSPLLADLLKPSLVQESDCFFLAGPWAERGRGLQIPKGGKNLFEKMLNEIEVSEYLGETTQTRALTEGLLFAFALKDKLKYLGSFQISVSWAFDKKCVVTFYKSRAGDPKIPFEVLSRDGKAFLEIST